MADFTVTTNLITIADADTDTNWAGDGSFFSGLNTLLDTDNEVQGTGCMSWGSKNSGTNYLHYDDGATYNCTNKHIYIWWRVDIISNLETYANGGIAVRLENGGNWADWFIGGSDLLGQYKGGFQCIVVDLNRTPSANSGWTHPTDLGAVSAFGIAIRIAAGSVKGVANCFIDAIRIGDGGIFITGGSGVDPANMEGFYSASSAKGNKWGLVDKTAGVYITRGNLHIGSSSFTGETYFKDAGQIVVFDPLEVSASIVETIGVDSGLYKFNITGSKTTCSLGTAIGTGAETLGAEGVIFKGTTYISSSVEFPLRPPIHIGTEVSELQIYGSTFDTVGGIDFGKEKSQMLGSKFELVDNSFASTRPLLRNLDGVASLVLRNKILSTSGSYSDGYPYAFKLIDTGSIDGGEWAVLNTYGFSSTGSTATENYEISNHDFTSDTRYLTVYANKTWDIINPAWTTPLNTSSIQFVTSGSNYVNERYGYNTNIVDPTGAPLSGSKAFIYEGLTTDGIYLSFNTGSIVSSILKAEYSPESGLANVLSQSYGSFANKFYNYGYTPFAAGITVTSEINQNITLISDSGITEADVDTARAYSGIIVKRNQTTPTLVINYDSGSTILSSGSTVTGADSGATGVVLEYLGDSIAGTVVLANGNGTQFIFGEVLEVGGSPYASASVLASEGGFSGSYTWVVEGGGAAMTNIYDHLAAKMDQFPLDSIYEDVIIWGQAIQTQLLYVGGAGYFTNRNSNLEEGVWMGGRGGGTIAYFTSDEGYQYIPPVSYTFTLTNLIDGSEVRIFESGSGEFNSLGDEITGVESCSNQEFSYTYTYAADVVTNIAILNTQYEYILIEELTLTNANSSIPIQQRFDRNYYNP